MGGHKLLHHHFLDSSALIKRVVDEPGSMNLQLYFENNVSYWTSSFCIAEALNVVKRKWNRRELDNQQYYITAWHVLSPYRPLPDIHLIDQHLGDPQVFSNAQKFSERYGVDLVDALQLYLMVHGSKTMVDGSPHGMFISADADLVKAARQEGVPAWDCVHEPSPPADVS